MIEKINDKFVITGVLTPLHNLISCGFGHEELIVDAMAGHLKLVHWDKDTNMEERLHDMNEISHMIDNEDLKKYIEFKKEEKLQYQVNDLRKDILRLERLINNRAAITDHILLSNKKKLDKLSANGRYITLKDIANAFIYREKPLYTIGSLRNIIISEKFGNVIVGYLDIFNLHLTFLKRGNRWVTPAAHWFDEKMKIDEDFLRKIRMRSKRRLN